MTTFYLVSTELRKPYEPRLCHVLRRLRSEIRDDLAMVEVEPPIPADVYDTAGDVRTLILAARHQGTSLFPVTEWPLAVYICQIPEQEKLASDAITSDILSILDW